MMSEWNCTTMVFLLRALPAKSREGLGVRPVMLWEFMRIDLIGKLCSRM